MWLLTQTGFVSAVRHVEENDRLIVRARDTESLRGLSEAAETQIQATPEADYPYRVELPRAVFSEWLTEQVDTLDYTDYKSRVTESRGFHYAGVLHEVWAVLHALTYLERDEDGASFESGAGARLSNQMRATVMPKFEGKKTGEPGKNSRESQPEKMLAKLPRNYAGMTPEEQAEWRRDFAGQILRRAR